MSFAPLIYHGKTRVDCPVCSGRDLLSSVAFEALPVLCSALHSDAESSREAGAGRFGTTFCRSCGHVFNATFEEDRIGYTQSYDSSLGFSPRFAAFEGILAEPGVYIDERADSISAGNHVDEGDALRARSPDHDLTGSRVAR
jgi:hypothetical protein